MSDEELQTTSLKYRGMAANVIPIKSKECYEKEFDKFMAWCSENNIEIITEDVLITFFENMSKRCKSSTLWKTYSMLRTMLNIRKNINISNFMKLQTLLNRLSIGYEPKKSKILEYSEIEKFINEAPDSEFLCIKVVLIMGYSGACAKVELTKMSLDDIQFKPNSIFVTVARSKTTRPRLFTITNEVWVNLIKDYASLRPADTGHKRFFLYYGRGRCTQQPMGVNKIGAIPKIIARFLRLEDPDKYSGLCFRRSSESHLARNGGEVITLKRHGGWKSSSVPESSTKASTKRIEVSEIMSTISGSISDEPSSTLQHRR